MVSLMFNLIPLLLINAAGPNLLVNPGFEDGIKGWKSDAAQVKMEAVKIDGRTAAHIVVHESGDPGPCSLYQEVNLKPGELLMARGEAMRKNMKDGLGAFLELSFYDAKGKRISAWPEDHVVKDNYWTTLFTPLHHMLIAPPKTARLRLSLVFQGHGEAYFDNLLLVRVADKPLPALTGPVKLKVTDHVVCDALFGFGTEDDGWFHSDKNLEIGITPEEEAQHDRRIQWVNPSWIRTFIWIKEWCPSGDFKTFDFDSPGMKSHYRSLDLYQKMGVRVGLVDTEWSMNHIYDNPEVMAPAIGELFEHLIKKKGYTCIKYWTLTNEPCSNYTRTRGYRFDHFTRTHELMKAEFKKRGLEIKIIGSDDADSFSFLQTCVADPKYSELTDIFCSHTYPRTASLSAIPDFFDNRMKTVESGKPGKPFIIGECGVLGDSFTSHDNPLMLGYAYAMDMSVFAIEGLNRGVAGFAIWTMYETYYPMGTKMQPGLWDFKDNGWKTRPIYHAWASFCRNTKMGDKVRKVESSSSGHVLGTVVNDTLFWVNRGDQPAEIIVEGLAIKETRVMEEKTLKGDTECGVLEPIKKGRFTAPARSFGYAK